MTTRINPSPKPSQAGPEIIVPLLADLIRRNDGTYLLRPRVVDSELDLWISARRAANLIGIGGRSIYRLIDPECPFLVHKRPLKGRCLISFSSVQTYMQATSDPDFWENRLQQKKLTELVRKKMASLRANKYCLHS